MEEIEEIKTPTYRAKEAVAKAMEREADCEWHAHELAELAHAYAAIVAAEATASTTSLGSKLLEEINNL